MRPHTEYYTVDINSLIKKVCIPCHYDRTARSNHVPVLYYHPSGIASSNGVDKNPRNLEAVTIIIDERSIKIVQLCTHRSFFRIICCASRQYRAEHAPHNNGENIRFLHVICVSMCLVCRGTCAISCNRTASYVNIATRTPVCEASLPLFAR
jgi:hypothetical protein